MGALLQLMALPATCMLLAWMRGGGAGVAALLRGVVALIAARAAVPARVHARAESVSAKGAGRTRRPLAAPPALHGAWPPGSRPARLPPLVRAFAAASPTLRSRRFRLRMPHVHAGSC